jgi:hypothetical protein
MKKSQCGRVIHEHVQGTAMQSLTSKVASLLPLDASDVKTCSDMMAKPLPDLRELALMTMWCDRCSSR